MSPSTPVKIVDPQATPSVKPTAAPLPAPAYSNVSRIFATPNEVVIDFAMNLNAFGQMVEEEAQILSRIVTSYDGAKRLWVHLTQTLQAYEQKYGVIELDVAKRIKAPQTSSEPPAHS